jgi:hypothetical protein
MATKAGGLWIKNSKTKKQSQLSGLKWNTIEKTRRILYTQ